MKEGKKSIGIFDSGYGGLTVFKEIVKKLPSYNFIYLGDNARTPYGTRSFETVYKYTKECVEYLFSIDCSLIILACNTASAKALRSIQQKDLFKFNELYRVLGVIRPTTEIAGKLTKSGKIGIMATEGTVNSDSYSIEIKKFFPEVEVFQQACPMWVPLVENAEFNGNGADFFIKKYIDELLNQNSEIDTIILACTHYPVLKDKIRFFLPDNIQIISQGEIVSKSLAEYLSRHPDLERTLAKESKRIFLTTEVPGNFDKKASFFYGDKVLSRPWNTSS